MFADYSKLKQFQKINQSFIHCVWKLHKYFQLEDVQQQKDLLEHELKLMKYECELDRDYNWGTDELSQAYCLVVCLKHMNYNFTNLCRCPTLYFVEPFCLTVQYFKTFYWTLQFECSNLIKTLRHEYRTIRMTICESVKNRIYSFKPDSDNFYSFRDLHTIQKLLFCDYYNTGNGQLKLRTNCIKIKHMQREEEFEREDILNTNLSKLQFYTFKFCTENLSLSAVDCIKLEPYHDTIKFLFKISSGTYKTRYNRFRDPNEVWTSNKLKRPAFLDIFEESRTVNDDIKTSPKPNKNSKKIPVNGKAQQVVNKGKKSLKFDRMRNSTDLNSESINCSLSPINLEKFSSQNNIRSKKSAVIHKKQNLNFNKFTKNAELTKNSDDFKVLNCQREPAQTTTNQKNQKNQNTKPSYKTVQNAVTELAKNDDVDSGTSITLNRRSVKKSLAQKFHTNNSSKHKSSKREPFTYQMVNRH